MFARRFFAVFALVTLAGCVSTPREPPALFAGDADIVLRAPEELGRTVVWRQRVTASWTDAAGASKERSFDAVLQRLGDTLTLIGLSPMGSVGFALTLRDGDVDVRNDTGQELLLPPRRVLRDVQRVTYPWVAGADHVLADGLHVRDVGDERVVEVWASGRVRERRFVSLGRETSAVVVTFEWDDASTWAPARAVLVGERYRLTVETLEETRLPDGAP